MKRREIEKKLTQLGWWFLEHGGCHDTWTNGQIKVSIPRHAEVNEFTGKGIIKKAKENPPCK